MSKIVLDNVESGYNLQKINTNFQKIADELNDKVLYRDNPAGEPNSVAQDLDLDGKNILNVGTLYVTDALTLSGTDITLVFQEAAEASAAAVAAAEAAAISEANAAASETATAADALTASTAVASIGSSVADAQAAELAAETAATDAIASAELANDWAVKMDAPVAGGEYSAKYWASQTGDVIATAAASATTATTKAAEAAASATSASGSATTATTKASEAASSSSSASAYAAQAQDWAIKTDGVVSGGEYSAKYWAQQAASIVSGGLIDDTITSSIKTWSSSKINTQINSAVQAIPDPVAMALVFGS